MSEVEVSPGTPPDVVADDAALSGGSGVNELIKDFRTWQGRANRSLKDFAVNTWLASRALRELNDLAPWKAAGLAKSKYVRRRLGLSLSYFQKLVRLAEIPETDVRQHGVGPFIAAVSACREQRARLLNRVRAGELVTKADVERAARLREAAEPEVVVDEDEALVPLVEDEPLMISSDDDVVVVPCDDEVPLPTEVTVSLADGDARVPVTELRRLLSRHDGGTVVFTFAYAATGPAQVRLAWTADEEK